MYKIKYLDWVLDKMEYYSLPMINCNEYIAIFYMSILFSLYFIKKNQKKFIYLPILFIVYIAIQLYSPIPKIQYYKEGAFLITHKGERIVLTNKKTIDVKRLRDITNATKVYRNNGVLRVGDKARIKKYKDNYTLNINNKNYILKMNNKKVNRVDCDIINFSDNSINKVIIFKNKVLF